MPFLRTLILTILLGCVAGGCKNAMYDENVALHRQNQELQQQLDSTNAQLRGSPDPAQMRAMQDELLERDRKLQEAQLQPRQVMAVAPAAAPSTPSIAGMETSYDKAAGTMTVNLPGDVLFDSGKADLKPSAQSTLNQVAAAIKQKYGGKAIRVEGHTDADPITKSKDEWEDNLDLSLARAAAVSRYLEQQGINPRQVTTSGYGQYRPRSNSSKAKNRRVEVVVVTR